MTEATTTQRSAAECAASISGDCLNESDGFEPCDTDDGECIHGGLPAPA